ncbi:site-specific integrase [Ureibacillus composti]|nr:site-specific integrase [Ureibacillus composti]
MAREKYYKTKKDSIYWYKDNEGKKKYAYRYKFHDHNGKRIERSSRKFNSIEECERALIEVKAQVLNGNVTQLDKMQTTLSEWFTIWLESKKKKIKVSTYSQYECFFRLYLNPLLGHYKLKQLTKMVVQHDLVDDMIERGLSEKTIRNTVTTLNSSLIAAVEEEYLDRRRFTSLDYRGAKPIRKMDTLTEKELNQLIYLTKTYCNASQFTVIFTIASTGMRKGESLALCWKDIDFDNKTISISRTRDYHSTRSAKTKNSIRTIDMNDELVNTLRRYRSWCIETKLTQGNKLKETDYVFISRSGEPVCYHYPNWALRKIIDKHQFREITIHTLRHTVASILVGNGVPVPTVAKILGDTINVVNEVYSHSLERKEKEAIEILGNIANLK